RIGDLWVRINRNDEAVKVFSKIADHYSKDGFFLKAIAIYKKINKLDPSKLDVYAKLADLYAKQGLAMEAKSQYQVLADYYLKHGDPANALQTYRKISELDPNSINVHVKLADLHSQIGQTAEALKEYDRVGKMLLKRGMLDEAVQVFKKALKIDAKNVELVESLVTALIEAKDLNNAQAIIEQALQTNKEHPRLLALWGKVLLSKGDSGSAMKALQRAVAADPNDPVVRESLADMYLKQNNADKALEMVVPLVERAVSRGERGTAVDLLQRVLRVDQGHTPTLERLVALYTRLNEETNILSSMNSLAEAHISRGEHQAAAGVLEKLIQREPQNAQHRNKLQFVRAQLGGGAAAAPPPSRPKTVDIPVAMEIEEPVPTFDDVAEISLDDAGTPVELDFSTETSSAPGARIVPAVELAAMETDVEAGEDIDFITEHLTEAEVFAKYGLAEKAIEHLRAVIERSPKHGPAYDRLFRIYLDEGTLDEARATANEYIGILQEKGDSAGVDAVRNEFIARGQALGAAPAPATAAKAKPSAPPPKIEQPPPTPAAGALLEREQEISFDVDAGPSGMEIELEAEAVPEPVAEEEFEIETEPGPVAEELTFEPPVEEVELPVEPDLPELTIGEAAQAGAADEPFFGIEAETPHAAAPSSEELAEVDFYIEQELFDEARGRLDNLVSTYGEDDEVVARRERLDAAIAAAEAAAAPPPPPPPAPKAAPPAPPRAAAPAKPAAPAPRPPMLSREEIESEILSALPDEEEEIIPAPAPPPPAAPPPPPPAVAATAVQEENLFADENDFFDLAAELESELEGDEVVSLSEEEQSLEEIFKEFKKGVEQQLDSEDYDT
ncbi:MAG TPA: tetratricopeptide repeat protein, partial [Thermoanaerobaculia bacterium]